jgi:hypothetical protein
MDCRTNGILSVDRAVKSGTSIVMHIIPFSRQFDTDSYMA